MKCSRNAAIALIVIYSVSVFFLMYMTLYSIDPFTFMRGTYIVVIFAMYLLAMTDGKWLYTALLVLQAVGLLFLPVNMDYYMSAEDNAEWKHLESELQNVLAVVPADDPWENTVAMYTMEPKAICALPGGLGVNFIMQDGVLPAEAEYLFFSVTPAAEQSSEWIVRDYAVFYEEFGETLEKEYSVIYQDDLYLVYRKTD
ncbi:MAG: hypothetical protein IJA29_04770 [Lachnospiraceae bacterium]|nr:hypothetical protein [Lachnospiraceae bacterium]